MYILAIHLVATHISPPCQSCCIIYVLMKQVCVHLWKWHFYRLWDDFIGTLLKNGWGWFGISSLFLNIAEIMLVFRNTKFFLRASWLSVSICDFHLFIFSLSTHLFILDGSNYSVFILLVFLQQYTQKSFLSLGPSKTFFVWFSINHMVDKRTCAQPNNKMIL